MFFFLSLEKNDFVFDLFRSAPLRDQSQSRYNVRQASGILMSDDDKIFQHLDDFSRRVEQVLDMTVTLNQFSRYEQVCFSIEMNERMDEFLF